MLGDGRFERLRFLAAGVSFFIFAWFGFQGLTRLARSAGIPSILEYGRPVTLWLLIGESWQEVQVAEDLTLAGYVLVFLTAVLSYYGARLVYYLDFAKAFTLRDLWLIAGWAIGSSLIALESHLLLVALAAYPPCFSVANSFWVLCGMPRDGVGKVIC